VSKCWNPKSLEEISVARTLLLGVCVLGWLKVIEGVNPSGEGWFRPKGRRRGANPIYIGDGFLRGDSTLTTS